MRIWKQTTTLGIIVLLIISCKADPVAPNDPITPVFQMAGELAVDHLTVDGDLLEIGTAIEFLKPGRISQLCARIPTAGVYRVTLWDNTSRNVLYSVSIEVEAGIPKCEDIVDVICTQGTSFLISVLSDDRYVYRHRTVPDEVVFTFETDDVILTYQSFFEDPVGFEYPVAWLDSRYLAGFADIVFYPDSD